VTPKSAGAATITVTGATGFGSAHVAVTVNGGTINVPSSLSFTGNGAGAQRFTPTELYFSGPFGATSSDTTVAQVTGPSSGGAFTVTPIGHGIAKITVTGAPGAKAQIPVSVSIGTIMPSPAALSFNGTGNSKPQSFTVTEPYYTGSFSAHSKDGTIAAVNPTSTNGTFNVTPVGIGTTTIFVTGQTGGGAAQVTVSVSAGVSTNHPSLTFLGKGAGAQTLIATQAYNSTTFNATIGDATIATIKPIAPAGTFQVTPLAHGQTSIHVTGMGATFANVPVTVNAGSVVIFTPSTPVSIGSGGGTASFSASIPYYTGSYTGTVAPAIASLSQTSRGTFTVTAINSGSATITITGTGDGVSGTLPLHITAGAIMFNKPSLSFTSKASQTFSANEANFSGQFQVTNFDSSVLNVTPAQASSNQPFTVTPVTTGNKSTSITVSDGAKTKSLPVTLTIPVPSPTPTTIPIIINRTGPKLPRPGAKPVGPQPPITTTAPVFSPPAAPGVHASAKPVVPAGIKPPAPAGPRPPAPGFPGQQTPPPMPPLPGTPQAMLRREMIAVDRAEAILLSPSVVLRVRRRG